MTLLLIAGYLLLAPNNPTPLCPPLAALVFGSFEILVFAN